MNLLIYRVHVVVFILQSYTHLLELKSSLKMSKRRADSESGNSSSSSSDSESESVHLTHCHVMFYKLRQLDFLAYDS